MLRIEKFKKFKSNFPILVGKNAISNHLCESLIKEISSSETFDDLIMGGRSRINKGSKNFKKYINKSKISKKLFQLFNSKKFYNKSRRKSLRKLTSFSSILFSNYVL